MDIAFAAGQTPLRCGDPKPLENLRIHQSCQLAPQENHQMLPGSQNHRPSRRRSGQFGAVSHLHPHATEVDETIPPRRSRCDFGSVQKSAIFSSTPHLLTGDFNSNSPIQQIDPEKCKPHSRQEFKDNGNKLPRRVIQKLLDAGYVDFSRQAKRVPKREPSAPSPPNTPASASIIFSPIRSTRHESKSAEVVDDRLANTYPAIISGDDRNCVK